VVLEPLFLENEVAGEEKLAQVRLIGLSSFRANRLCHTHKVAAGHIWPH
jgi:hypothetical protein